MQKVEVGHEMASRLEVWEPEVGWGRTSEDQLAPSQCSASGKSPLVRGSPVPSQPTAQQSLSDRHLTPLSWLPMAGVPWMTQAAVVVSTMGRGAVAMAT